MVYPALLPLMRTPRLPAVDWTDSPAGLNGLVCFAERRILVSARVPSHFNWPVPQLVKKFPAFYGTRRFITAFTSARHLSLSWARRKRFIASHPTSRTRILMLFSHPCGSIPSGVFPCPHQNLYTPLLFLIPTTCTVQFIHFDLITRKIFGGTYHKDPRYVVFSIPLLKSHKGYIYVMPPDYLLPYMSILLLTLYLLRLRIWWAPNNGRKRQMGFNSAFKHIS